MAISAVLPVIPVSEFDAACDWYETFFGRPADRKPMDSLAEWQISDLGVLQVFHNPDEAGRTAVNFIVDDLDERIANLAFRPLGVTRTNSDAILGEIRGATIDSARDHGVSRASANSVRAETP